MNAPAANVGFSRERLRHAMELAQAIQDGRAKLSDRSWLQHETALLDAETSALEETNWRVLTGDGNSRPAAFASVLKLKG